MVKLGPLLKENEEDDESDKQSQGSSSHHSAPEKNDKDTDEKKSDGASSKRAEPTKKGEGDDKDDESEHSKESEDKSKSGSSRKEDDEEECISNDWNGPSDGFLNKLFSRKRSVRGSSGDERNTKFEDIDDAEKSWSPVTPEMIVKTLERNTVHHMASTIKEIVDALQQHFTVCPVEKELLKEVTDKMLCAEEIGLVISDGRKKYRLSSPSKQTITEAEIEEFWAKYRDILRRSLRPSGTPRQDRCLSARRNPRARPRPRKRKVARQTQLRRVPAHTYFDSSDDSSSGGCECSGY